MRRTKLFFISCVGLMAALVFVSSKVSVPIPLPIGNTRLHLGNVFCVLSGLLLGPVGGGLSAGIGSFFFDLTDPLHISSAPFTFVFKFMLAFITGMVAYAKKADGLRISQNAVGGIFGSLTYVILYLGRSFLSNVLFLKVELPVAIINTLQKGGVSVANACIAVAVAVPLCFSIRKALEKSNLRLYQDFTAGH